MLQCFTSLCIETILSCASFLTIGCVCNSQRKATVFIECVHAFICSLFQSAAAAAAAVEPPFTNLFEYRPNVPGISDRRTGELLTISICLSLESFVLFIHFL